MTLVELVVVIGLIGLVVTVLSAAIVVTLRQAPTLNARLDNARWEQNLGTWLPADLTSADIPSPFVKSDDEPPVDIPNPDYYDPTDATFPGSGGIPGCVPAVCGFGVNVLHLEWVEGNQDVVVTYRYGPSSAGQGKDLLRVECRAGSCSSVTVVRGMHDINGGPPFSATTPPGIPYVDP